MRPAAGTGDGDKAALLAVRRGQDALPHQQPPLAKTSKRARCPPQTPCGFKVPRISAARPAVPPMGWLLGAHRRVASTVSLIVLLHVHAAAAAGQCGIVTALAASSFMRVRRRVPALEVH